MRAVVITKHGDADVLEVEERPSPSLRPGAVRIDVRAAGVNFADVMARLGLYADAPPLPSVVGYEVAGTIGEVAADVVGLAVGDRVVAGTRFGGYAEQVCADARDVIALPDSLSFEQGAAIPVNYATAWAGLVGYANLRAGERVLIQAAAGGVGIAATQIAKHVGAEVYGTASPGKHDAIRGFGVDVALDYRKRGWDSGLPPMDVIMDAIGGESLRRSYGQLRPGGRLVAFGASSVVAGDKRNLLRAAPQALRMMRGFNLIDQMSESKTVIGLNMLRLWDDRGTLEPWITPLRELIENGVVAPVVSDAVPFADAPEAHRILTERRNVGKVVLVP
ncbi:zinc-binding dehydrogenase [Rhodococcus maanshanensis]|uniref:zinc-binding dehydrogenase n=1 Tax=Rhodococcus maanshanensis TaxID=183556 RepID=UPI0022B58EA0|nr:zinc-binding dehydrogenase [Rhodococcus maanshanensis]MCZ4556662.1 zinc-binding dehydrogenase [Rhodococcus maanshanensis]